MAIPKSIRTLAPPQRTQEEKDKELNPIRIAMSLSGMQWLLFISGFLAWSMDAYDFFCVALTIPLLAAQFNRSTHSITTAITLTLLFRTVGAIIFGFTSDRFGRKWPLIFNLMLIACLEVIASFATTFPQFLAVRATFGVAMGGIWGQAAATSLENMPVEARGLFSGFLQQGYAFGYLIAAVVDLKLVPRSSESWRVLFRLGSGLCTSVALLRAVLPESQVFLRAREEAQATGHILSQKEKTRVFLRETGAMLRKHWSLCLSSVFLMSGFNFLSHGSQDLYPTFMKVSKGLSDYDATVATIIGNCGAIAGGIIAGWLSQRLGRRLTIIIFTLFVCAFIPLWILPNSFSALAAGAFFLQVGVQGAWGVIPIHLNELSPPGFRSTFPGVAYQLGNLLSSGASQMEAIAGAYIKTTICDRTTGQCTTVPDYGKVQGVLVGFAASCVIVMIIMGTENHGSQFEQEKLAIEEKADQELGLHDIERNVEDEDVKPVTENIEDAIPARKKRHDR